MLAALILGGDRACFLSPPRRIYFDADGNLSPRPLRKTTSSNARPFIDCLVLPFLYTP